MDDYPTFDFKVDDKSYVVDLRKFSITELRDLHAALGMPFGRALAGGTDMLVYTAALKWIIDRRQNKKLSFEDVADSLTVEQVSFEDVEVEEDPPTQEGGSKVASLPSAASTGSNPGKSSA